MPQALSAITTVMDTIDALQARQEITRPDDLEERVRAIYRNQGMPVEEAVLQQAVALYFASEAAASPVPVVVEPTQAKPAVASVPEPQVATPRATSSTSTGGLSLLEILLGLGMVMMVGTASFAMISSVRGRSAEAEVASALVAATQHSPVEVNHLLQTELQDRLETVGIQVQVQPDPPGGPWAGHPTLLVSHAAPSFVGRLSQAALQAHLPLAVNGQAVHSVSEALAATHGTRGDAVNALVLGGETP